MIGDLFNEIFFRPVLNLLIIIINGLQSWGVPGALGFSIIILSLIIRLVIWPLLSAQLKTSKKLADIKPHLDELKRKHKDDRQALAQAQMALYKEHGVNPAGGCLPALLQIPIFIALVNTLSTMFDTSNGLTKINEMLYSASWKLDQLPDPSFFGLNLAAKPSEFATMGVYLLLIPLLTGVLTFVQSKMTMPKPVKPYPSDSPKEEKEKESMEDAMGQVQSQMVYMMPAMMAFFAFSFPVGFAFYLVTFTVLGIYQQYKIAGWGGLESWINRSTPIESPVVKVESSPLKKNRRSAKIHKGQRKK